jgi:alginate O-acetyltransferase complex protein AlgI
LLFNSYIFLAAFLPVTLLLYYLVRGKVGLEASFVVLCLASLAYYAYWKVSYLPILLVSIVGNYYLGRLLSGFSDQGVKKFTLVIGIVLNLSALGYYKYANFFVETIEYLLGTTYSSVNIVLPLAISFFTFQQIAYLVDAYRGEVKDYKFIHYFLFVTFFPQLIAGPIVHHKDMLPQFMSRASRLIDRELPRLGVLQFSIGLFKKVIIADTLALYATPVFSAADQGLDITMIEAWIGILAYTFQLYFDFSGYSDMALGIGKMFGINLPVNFNSPYKAVSIQDFWRRWHMTLSRFLRDYLYIALGGNRKGPMRRQVNLFLTMLLGGLWHGASWNFVVWGALHGAYLVINHSWGSLCHKLGWSLQEVRGYRWLAGCLTFLAVIQAWVLFRAETFSGASAIYRASIDFQSFSLAALLGDGFPTVSAPLQALFVIVVGAAVAFYCPNVQEFIGRLQTKPEVDEIPGRWVAVSRRPIVLSTFIALMLVVSVASMSRISEFLYFQF